MDQVGGQRGSGREKSRCRGSEADRVCFRGHTEACEEGRGARWDVRQGLQAPWEVRCMMPSAPRGSPRLLARACWLSRPGNKGSGCAAHAHCPLLPRDSRADRPVTQEAQVSAGACGFTRSHSQGHLWLEPAR